MQLVITITGKLDDPDEIDLALTRLARGVRDNADAGAIAGWSVYDSNGNRIGAVVMEEGNDSE